MTTSLDNILATLESVRTELLSSANSSSLTPESIADRYTGIDRLVRRVLLTAARSLWSVPKSELKSLGRGQELSPLVSIAGQYAPTAVSRELLSRARVVYHHIRNKVEHEDYKVSLQETMEYLELAESLVYSIFNPSIPSPPLKVLGDLTDYEFLEVWPKSPLNLLIATLMDPISCGRARPRTVV